jgi:hypothetical protein
MQALHDIVKDGHARYIGMSSCWAWQFQLMQRESHTGMSWSCSLSEYAIQNRLTPFISMQNFHNAMYREVRRFLYMTDTADGAGRTRDDAYSPAFRSGLYPLVTSSRWTLVDLCEVENIANLQTWLDHTAKMPVLSDPNLAVYPYPIPPKPSSAKWRLSPRSGISVWRR